MTTEPQTDRPRALHLLEAADFLRDAHFRDGLSVQEAITALRHMADEADPMVGSLARERAAELAWQVVAVDRGAKAEAPLSPDYEHPDCGFHWHGRDGMDIPMRDGQPVCPRCELRRVEKLLAHRERRCQELRVESKRRGRNVLEQSEKNRVLERQIDSIREQLGAEILRAGEAETELRRLAAETPGPETQGAVLAAALDGLHTLIATSSRDWGQYRVDAWLWAVLVGWDCEEQHEHDELCDNGAAMTEMQRMHGWNDEAVAKARRYRAAVRVLTEPAVVAEPGKEG